AAAQAVAMDGSRDQLFADAALALNEDGRVGRRRPPDGGHHLLQRGALADQLVPDLDRFLERAILVAKPSLIERIAQAHEHPLACERLLDEVERPFFGRLDRRADRAVA